MSAIMPGMELRGPTTALRLPVASDAEGLLAHGADPEVTRWFSWGPYRSVDEPLAWIAQQRGRREAVEQLDLVIHHAEHGPVGVTGLGEPSLRDRRAVVGTWLGRALWGSGVNAEAKALVAHLAFSLLGMDRLGAYSNPENVRSTAALERLGFVREGTLRRFHRHRDRALDVHVFGLVREDWERGPLREVPVVSIGAPPAAWVVSPPAGTPS
jgi:[ribosomal protein S5]-alanine N-acetyltransferase